MKVGYIPEHFSTPLIFANKKFFKEFHLTLQLIPFPSGSGHLIQALNNNEIDVAIGLTEAFVRGIADTKENEMPNYKIVGTYVNSPLNWSISTGINRDDIKILDDLEGKKIGVSRIGSGSYVMSFVLSLNKNFIKPFESYPICNTFTGLRESVNNGECDAFMWEYFTTKKYYNSNEIKMLGNISTPWPSWIIVKHKDLSDENIINFCCALDKGIKYFYEHPSESIKYISTDLDYSEDDAVEWMKTVEFNIPSSKISHYEATITNTLQVLKAANVLVHKDDSIIMTNISNGMM